MKKLSFSKNHDDEERWRALHERDVPPQREEESEEESEDEEEDLEMVMRANGSEEFYRKLKEMYSSESKSNRDMEEEESRRYQLYTLSLSHYTLLYKKVF